MTTLKKVRESGELEQFIREHEKDPLGDMDKLDAVIGRSSQGTEKSNQEASTPDSGDD